MHRKNQNICPVFMALITICLCHALYPADSTTVFCLSEYKPPAFSYHLLEIHPNASLSGNTGDENSDIIFLSGMEDSYHPYGSSDQYSSANSSAGLSANHACYGWKKSIEWQVSNAAVIAGNMGIDPGRYDEQYDGDYTYYNEGSNIQGSGGYQFSITAAHYFAWPFFIGASVSPGVRGSGYKGESSRKRLEYSSFSDSGKYWHENTSRYRHSYSISSSSVLSAGIGHIDEVTFAAVAINMLDVLNKSSGHNYRKSDIQKLAAFLEVRKKRRSFDSRSAFIEDIDSLCGFLKINGMSSNISPREILELADQWQYAFRQKRSSGYKIVLYPEFGALLNVNDYTNSSTVCTLTVKTGELLNENDETDYSGCIPFNEGSDQRSKNRNVDYGLCFGAGYSLPITRYIQFSAQATAKAWRSLRLAENTYNETWKTKQYEIPSVYATVYLEMSYFPNTRTSVSLIPRVTYNREFDYSALKYNSPDQDTVSLSTKNDYRNLSLEATVSAYYYFSPQLSGTLGLNASWDDRYQYVQSNIWDNDYYDNNSTKGFNISISAGVTWAVF